MRLVALVALTTMAAIAAACGVTAPPSRTTVGMDVLQSQQWTVSSIGHATPPVAGTEMDLLFIADGTVTGKAGCNTFRTTYTVKDGSLRFGPVATTQMACSAPVMAQEQAFLQALDATRSGVLFQDVLRLHDQAGATTMVLKRVPIPA
jgi:heat shock protein HslJ